MQAPTAIGDYTTGEHRIIVRTISLPEQSELHLEDSFAEIAGACDGQTLSGADGEGLTLTALDDDATAGFHQSVTASSPLWEEVMAELLAMMDTHRVVSQDGNNVVEVMGGQPVGDRGPRRPEGPGNQARRNRRRRAPTRRRARRSGENPSPSQPSCRCDSATTLSSKSSALPLDQV